MNLYKCINYIKRHKLILGIIILIFGIFLCYSPIIEGLTGSVGEYEFLAPSTDNISDDMWNKLAEKISKLLLPMTVEQVKELYKGNITNKEINYYLENGTYPINPYIKKTMLEYYKSLKPNTTSADVDTSINQLPTYTARTLYGPMLKRLDEAKTPQPDGYLIYMGTKPPPSYSTPTYSVNNSTTSMTDAIPTGTDLYNNRNYDDFVSLCKRVTQ